MKITVRPKEKVEEKVTVDDIKSGTVFQYDNEIIALKLDYNEVLILKHSTGTDWLEIAGGYKNASVKGIFGRLDEIIVVEE